MKKTKYLSLGLIAGVLIVFISVTGCSDVPYTGPTLTVGHVDQYLSTIEQDTVCLQDGFDTVCVKLFLDNIEIDTTDIGYTPTVHVHPTNIAYVFDYQGKPILHAKREMDTTQIVQELAAAGRVNLPSNGDNFNIVNGDSVPEGWTIQIYATDTLDIRVVEGPNIGANKQKDLQIIQRTQIDGGVQFAIETKDAEITVQVNGLIPGNTATFHISANNVASDDSTNILKLKPIQ